MHIYVLIFFCVFLYRERWQRLGNVYRSSEILVYPLWSTFLSNGGRNRARLNCRDPFGSGQTPGYILRQWGTTSKWQFLYLSWLKFVLNLEKHTRTCSTWITSCQFAQEFNIKLVHMEQKKLREKIFNVLLFCLGLTFFSFCFSGSSCFHKSVWCFLPGCKSQL